MTEFSRSGIIKHVLQSPADRPYVQAWLKRVGRQLRGSGKLSQVALALSIEHGGCADEWSSKLRDILTGRQQPGADLIADIDHLLSKPRAAESSSPSSQGLLF